MHNAVMLGLHLQFMPYDDPNVSNASDHLSPRTSNWNDNHRSDSLTLSSLFIGANNGALRKYTDTRQHNALTPPAATIDTQGCFDMRVLALCSQTCQKCAVKATLSWKGFHSHLEVFMS